MFDMSSRLGNPLRKHNSVIWLAWIAVAFLSAFCIYVLVLVPLCNSGREIREVSKVHRDHLLRTTPRE